MTRRFYGATYLLDQIWHEIGIVDDLKVCFPDNYKRILSIAYFLILEDTDALIRFEHFDRTHKHPAGQDIPSQRSSELFQSITEEAKDKFFRLQGRRHIEKEYWAYDTTSISSYSETLKQVKYGKNKDDDHFPQINLALLFGEKSGLPFYYRKLAGNIPDVKTMRYIFNDIKDVNKDRKHPVKCNRPIAAGTISIKIGYLLSAMLLILSFAISLLAGRSLFGIAVWGCYLVINILYSCWLKRIAFIDVLILVACYVIRIIYGGVIINVRISPYLYLAVFVLAFFMSMGKRRNEVKLYGKAYREALKGYTYEFLDKFMYVWCALAITFYSMWCLSNDEQYGGARLVFTVPLVVIILMRYISDIEMEEAEGDPITVIKKDYLLIVLSAVFIIVLFVCIYGSKLF